MGQRLVRAKTKIRQARIPLRIPEREELPERLETVLDAIYAAFSEGWLDAVGTDPARRDLAEEAIYLGRLVTELLPGEPEALGLLALMLYAEARRRARRGPEGEYIALAEQDISLWDHERIRAAETALRRAGAIGLIGRYSWRPPSSLPTSRGGATDCPTGPPSSSYMTRFSSSPARPSPPSTGRSRWPRSRAPARPWRF
jgi:RNA polymerase sigma-70 factor (ECF subfamily)